VNHIACHPHVGGWHWHLSGHKMTAKLWKLWFHLESFRIIQSPYRNDWNPFGMISSSFGISTFPPGASTVFCFASLSKLQRYSFEVSKSSSYGLANKKWKDRNLPQSLTLIFVLPDSTTQKVLNVLDPGPLGMSPTAPWLGNPTGRVLLGKLRSCCHGSSSCTSCGHGPPPSAATLQQPHGIYG
jgi:hypothetical protein